MVPREFALKEDLYAAKAQWRAATYAVEKKAPMAWIARLEMEYNIEREAYRKFLK